MEPDAYIFFTECHRLYIQGVRRALRERLESAFGDNWWEKGVLHALNPDHLTNLQAETERNPDRERHLLLDAPHFGWIINKHHNDIFSDAFTDTIRTFKEMRRLSGFRNEWAHMQSMPLPRVWQAAGLMRQILASLSCEEALEIERMSQERAFDASRDEGNELLEEMADQDGDLDAQESTTEPWVFWRQLQSCLVMEKSVEVLEEQADHHARVTFKVHNTAPDSRNLPAVHFRTVTISASSVGAKELGGMSPGDSRETEFVVPIRQLLEVEFEILGEIDANRLFQFNRTTSIPEEVVAPLRREFLDRLESIGVREFVSDVLDKIGAPGPNMTLAEIANVRQSLKLQSGLADEKRLDLGQLFKEFHLTRESTLGGRTREIILGLEDFGEKLQALDKAMGRTDVQSMTEAANDLKQVQLAVLRVEDTIWAMANTS